jgi:hypothetical protein
MKKRKEVLAMFKRIAIAFWIILFFFVMAIPAYSGGLDGKTFLGQSGEKGKDASGEEELRFQNGKLYSAGCAEWGFGESDYTARVEGDNIHFESEMLSPKHGKIVWNGTVKGDKVDATYVWTKKRWYWKDAHQEKWLKGTLNN